MFVVICPRADEALTPPIPVVVNLVATDHKALFIDRLAYVSGVEFGCVAGRAAKFCGHLI